MEPRVVVVDRDLVASQVISVGGGIMPRDA